MDVGLLTEPQFFFSILFPFPTEETPVTYLWIGFTVDVEFIALKVRLFHSTIFPDTLTGC